MNTVPDLPYIRSTLVDRIAQHLSNRRKDERVQPNAYASQEMLLATEDAIAFWQEQANAAATPADKAYALEKISKLTQFLEARPNDVDVKYGTQRTHHRSSTPEKVPTVRRLATNW